MYLTKRGWCQKGFTIKELKKDLIFVREDLEYIKKTKFMYRKI